MSNPNPTPPPEHTKWKPGQSGNPKGYPKGQLHSATRMRKLLDLREKIKNPVTGEVEDFTVLEMIDAQLIIKARRGDLPAIRELLDRIEGRPNQSIDHTTAGHELPNGILGGASVRKDNSNRKDTGTRQKD